MAKLQDSFTIRGKKIRNRIVMPPVVMTNLNTEDGKVSQGSIDHYRAIAKGGVGLVVTEAFAICEKGKLADKQIGIWDDDKIDEIQNLMTAIHQEGAVTIIQMVYAGVNTTVKDVDYLSPSPCEAAGNTAREISPEEIKEVQGFFVAAAIRAKKAGADGVEIHGAHNYLLARFFDARSNLRTDTYGGSVENRMKIATELVAPIRKACGDDFIIAIRAGSNITSREEGIEALQTLEKAGYDLLDISFGIMPHGAEYKEKVPQDFPCSAITYFGGQIKQHVAIPTVVVNQITTPEQAQYLLEHNMSDFVAVGRATLKDNAWAEKALAAK